MTGVLVAAGALAGLVLVSYLVEALRLPPAPPERLPWAPEIPIRYLDVDGTRLRYIVTGEGPALVLLHTLRTQLDMFQKVIPELARRFRVYAVDYPGHGHSDIPRAEYSPDFFVRHVAGFLDRLELTGVTLAGESIGGSIALLLAARQHPRVRQVVAINPYDYDAGRGLRRASPVANLVLGLGPVPLLGPTVMRLRQPPIEKLIFQGGVHRRGSLSPALLRELYRVGNRRGHYRAFLSLIRNWPGWERARSEYGRIVCPVLLVYGEFDWSRGEEREANRRAIPGVSFQVIPNAGHFLSLDAPDEVVQAVAGVAK